MSVSLTGLTVAPAQVRGAFRLVPLLRVNACRDVRLTARPYHEDLAQVDLHDGTAYWAFVPHALVLDWGGERRATMGGQVRRADGQRKDLGWLSVRHLDKMAKREGRSSLRFLPLHTAMEGFLALHFGGPRIAWPEYSTAALRDGLGSRSERAVSGRLLSGFEDALRTFEIHDGQVGVLVFVADTLASAFVLPNPEDYRQLHRTLLEDFYGELIARYALLYPETPLVQAAFEAGDARSLADVREALVDVRARWAAFTRDVMLADLIDRPVSRQRVYQPGQLTLERFMTDLDPGRPNHIGERLVREDGEVLYLKTFLLSAAQVRRAHLLGQLAAHEWHLGDTAAALNTTIPDLVRRIEGAGFGDLLKAGVRQDAERARRQPR